MEQRSSDGNTCMLRRSTCARARAQRRVLEEGAAGLRMGMLTPAGAVHSLAAPLQAPKHCRVAISSQPVCEWRAPRGGGPRRGCMHARQQAEGDLRA